MTRASNSTQPVWDREALRNPHQREDKAGRVRRMFDAIAGSYERVNRVASLGQDARWRRRTIAAAEVRAGDVVLDLCCGTGDMLREFAADSPTPRLAIGVDFARQMLARGKYDSAAPALLRGDALRIPLRDASVDVITCAFGVRNFQSLQGGLNEMARVLRPGGRVCILEFCEPENALLRWAHRTYCNSVLPRIGTWLSGDRSGAYRYLPQSIATFEPIAVLVRRLEDAGFSQVGVSRMNFGGVALYRGVRAAGH
ncbi:MAG: ubiquinone/menaquinone biosynthesis methyltransferase [Phycisphaerae bacterium]